MRIAIITVSDSSADGIRADSSGPTLAELIRKSEKVGTPFVSDPLIIRDDLETIKETIIQLAKQSDVIITTGGTGWSPRDVTPEATLSVIDRRCGGVEVALHMRSLQATPFAALSRLSAGIRDSTFIVNFPGSPKAVKECWEVIEPILHHGVGVLLNKDESTTHTKIQSK